MGFQTTGQQQVLSVGVLFFNQKRTLPIPFEPSFYPPAFYGRVITLTSPWSEGREQRFRIATRSDLTLDNQESSARSLDNRELMRYQAGSGLRTVRKTTDMSAASGHRTDAGPL